MSREGESGQTLVELLVVITLSLIVLLATLKTFDVFGSGSVSNSRVTTAEDTDRAQVDVMTRVLRDARPRPGQSDAVLVPASGSGAVNDLAITTYASGGGTANVLHVNRFCVNTTTRALWREVLDDASTYSAPGAACPANLPGWTRAMLVDGVANTAAAPLFTVDATRRAVDVDLRVDVRNSSPLELRSSAFLRLPTLSSTAAAPVAVTQSCNGTIATLAVTGTSASATFSTTLSNGAKITLGTGTSVSFPAATSTLVTPVVTNATGVLQTLAATAVVCP